MAIREERNKRFVWKHMLVFLSLANLYDISLEIYSMILNYLLLPETIFYLFNLSLQHLQNEQLILTYDAGSSLQVY